MKILLAIGIGSFIGGILRYSITELIRTKFLITFPAGTLTVNLIGCLLIGLVFGLAEKGNMTHEWRLFLATGLLGGFTTFSAFSTDTLAMIVNGQFWYAMAYVSASVVIGLLATYAGFSIIKLF